MSHHLDSPLSRKDPRLNITDLYVFRGSTGTVLILNVNSSLAGPQAPKGFNDEARYNFYLIGSDRARIYRARFGPLAADGAQPYNIQQLDWTKPSATIDAGHPVSSGVTGGPIAEGPIRSWVGAVVDPFSVNPGILNAVAQAFESGSAVDIPRGAWAEPADLMSEATVYSIVLEVPDEADGLLVPGESIEVWASTEVSDHHGGWCQINRAGRPMISPVFNPANSDEASNYNMTQPDGDLDLYYDRFAAKVTAVVCAQGSDTGARAYGEAVAGALLPDRLPYRVGAPARFGMVSRNGRALSDNVAEIIFSLVANRAIPNLTGVSSSRDQLVDFPYVESAGERRGRRDELDG